MVNIAITGASGFIGSYLVREAAKAGYIVRALSRSGSADAASSETYRWSLGETIPVEACRNTDYAIHLAHDFDGEPGSRRTVEGTLAAVETFRSHGARRQLLFSSLSARPDATSLYGTTKLEMERRVANQPDVVIVRPGLVLGAGGIYGRIRHWARTFPLVPLPDGGRGKVCVVDVELLCQQTLAVLTAKSDRREFNLFDPHPKSLRELVMHEARQTDRRILIVSVPSRLLLFALALCERLGVPLPVKSDNLVGFLTNQSDLHQATLVEPY